MSKYVIYKTSTGEILSYGVNGPITLIPDTDPEEYWVPFDLLNVPSGADKLEIDEADTVSDATHYVDISGTPTVTSKPTFDSLGNSLSGDSPWIADGASTIEYGPSIPSGTECVVSCKNVAFGDAYTETITTGEIELATPIAGLYEIYLSKFPYLDKTIAVNAEAP